MIYVREKERCKELLDISKAKLDEVDEETRNAFKAMEEVRSLLLTYLCVFRFRAENDFYIAVGDGARAKRRSAERRTGNIAGKTTDASRHRPRCD